MKNHNEPSGRAGWRGVIACIVTLALVCGRADAQRLNLDAPAAPAPGPNDSSRAMKASLPDARVGRADDALPDAAGLGTAARSRTHALTLALIGKGEELGEAGSIHIAHAMTLLADMAWPSEMALRAVSGEPDAEMIGAAMRAYVRAVDALLADGRALPDTPGELDMALRSVFAPLAEIVPPESDPLAAGWALAQTGPVPTVDELRAQLEGAPAGDPSGTTKNATTGLDDPTRAVLLDLLGVIAGAQGTWSFAAAALDARATLAGALPIVLGGLPTWFPETRRAQVSERTGAALRAFAHTTRDDDAAELLATASNTLRICAWTDALSPGGGGGGGGQTARDAQSIRLAIADTAAEAMGEAGPARDRARKSMRALVRTLDLIDERIAAGTEAGVTQSLRTSFRALDSARARSEAQLTSQVAEIARAQSATSQPAIVSAIASHRRSIDDLKMLRLVDGLLTRFRDDQSPSWRLVTSRLTRLGQEVARPATMESALLDLRAFAAAMELLDPFAGEPALRAAALTGDTADAANTAILKELTGDRAGAIIARIDELRIAYLQAWAREGDDRTASGRNAPARPGVVAGEKAESIAARLRVLRMLCGFLEDLRAVRALALPEVRALRQGLLAWRGLPISVAGAAFLGGGEELSRVAADVVTQALDNADTGTERPRTSLRKLEAAHPTLRLLAALDRGALERGIIAVSPYASLASPPTRGAWMVGHRARLAAIARYVDEAAAVAKDNPRDAGKIMDYVNMLAGQVER